MAADFSVGDKKKLLYARSGIEGFVELKDGLAKWSGIRPLADTLHWVTPENDVKLNKTVTHTPGGFIDTVYELDPQVRMRIRERLDDEAPTRVLIQSKISATAADDATLKKPKVDIRSDVPTEDVKALLERLLK